ncbi:hypothetical protein D3C78_1730330 [compost metagenome]
MPCPNEPLILPLKPTLEPFLSLMLITPAFPAASYLAGGFVMISTWLMLEEDIFFNMSATSELDM